ncbi:MAG: hypothetical protein GTO03_07255 [Planctomycetales bacterium]|nr:hypothetical protein [Planctomycetales bacterium]
MLALGLDGGGLRIVAFPEFAGGPYLRGLARTDRFYVGVSRCGERAERHGPENDSAVLVLDDDLVEVGRIELQGTGQLCEVRALDGDRAHNRLPCPFRG